LQDKDNDVRTAARESVVTLAKNPQAENMVTKYMPEGEAKVLCHEIIRGGLDGTAYVSPRKLRKSLKNIDMRQMSLI
jgi:hypothetical protein